MIHSSKALFFQFCVDSGHNNSTNKTTSAKEYNPACSTKKMPFFAAILVLRMNDVTSDDDVDDDDDNDNDNNNNNKQ